MKATKRETTAKSDNGHTARSRTLQRRQRERRHACKDRTNTFSSSVSTSEAANSSHGRFQCLSTECENRENFAFKGNTRTECHGHGAQTRAQRNVLRNGILLPARCVKECRATRHVTSYRAKTCDVKGCCVVYLVLCRCVKQVTSYKSCYVTSWHGMSNDVRLVKYVGNTWGFVME